MGKKKILLVEGETDKKFFQKICKYLDLDVEVTVSTPEKMKSHFY